MLREVRCDLLSCCHVMKCTFTRKVGTLGSFHAIGFPPFFLEIEICVETPAVAAAAVMAGSYRCVPCVLSLSTCTVFFFFFFVNDWELPLETHNCTTYERFEDCTMDPRIPWDPRGSYEFAQQLAAPSCRGGTQIRSKLL